MKKADLINLCKLLDKLSVFHVFYTEMCNSKSTHGHYHIVYKDTTDQMIEEVIYGKDLE